MKALLFLTCCSVDIWLCACRTVHPTGKAVPGILACLYLHSVLCIHPDPPCPASVTHKGFCHSCPWELPRQQSNDSSLLQGCLYLWGEHSPLQEAAVKLFENYPCLVPVAPLKFPNVTKEIRPGRWKAGARLRTGASAELAGWSQIGPRRRGWEIYSQDSCWLWASGQSHYLGHSQRRWTHRVQTLHCKPLIQLCCSNYFSIGFPFSLSGCWSCLTWHLEVKLLLTSHCCSVPCSC